MVFVVCPVPVTDLTENFDRVFWLGDFNFRVTLERSQVDGMLETCRDQHNPQCEVSLYRLCFFFVFFCRLKSTSAQGIHNDEGDIDKWLSRFRTLITKGNCSQFPVELRGCV